MPALSLNKTTKKFDLSCGIERVVGNAKDRTCQMIFGMVLGKGDARRTWQSVVGPCL
jgi:hypothetical protein